ncbi:ParB/RepB/Spo0J family partition protein [Paenirhodobacter populi]|uniref:ParB/RepB/Spo0J family partition protein n=1 Tax=Paenirhodobacter populi TaxID=2306993 RepID=A0A443IRE0_9RHOB|nr:ParB/RepB/Spo0J family partition protein [Sinirhodobacter populi]RWR09202.1 ParB/RepB/Spo0J family partition protein [Sinirhodobacter populi]
MAKAVQKITLSRSCDIPFDRLVLSQANVRKIKADISIEELAEDIARRGLLQNLNVRALLDGDGNETGMFDVPAGGRRYQALALLVKQKRLAKNASVPCIMREGGSDILAEDDSLAENTQRAALHPLDQFRAFRTLREKGQTEEQIAATFFVPASVVKQRLRLVSVAEELLDVYAADQMSLEQLMAFTVTSDNERQIEVWNNVKDRDWPSSPQQIRRKLTETAVRCLDKRVRFIGLEAYEQAGGTRTRDLFEEDSGGWVDDIGLLDRLVTEKLKAEAAAIAAEGWKWVDADTSFEYGHTFSLSRVTPVGQLLTEKERAERESLRSEYEDLESEYAEADEYPDEIDARIGEIEAALDAYGKRPEIYKPTDQARAGAFVSIGEDGKLVVKRGFVRPEDEASVVGEADARDEADSQEAGDGHHAGTSEGSDRGTAVVTVVGEAAQPEEDESETIKPLPDRLISELTAYRTLALQDAIARNPHVALTALLHKLVTDAFRSGMTPGRCLEASVRAVHPVAQPDDLAEFPPALEIIARHNAWAEDIPQDDDSTLWTWLTGLDDASRLALLAHCVSFGINALHEKPNPYSGYGLSQHALDCRKAEADRLALATGLDMVEAGWKPTAANYLGRVTKARIVEAVRESVGEDMALRLVHEKKEKMIQEAERLLAGRGWLPEPLRIAGIEETTDAAPGVEHDAGPAEEVAVADLPAFLADDVPEDVPASDQIVAQEAEDLVAAE